MKILIADDESPKFSNIELAVRETYPSAQIYGARSVRSAIDQILAERPDLVVLDMSLPTFDVASEESGGRAQGFGGIEVLRHMDFHEVTAPIIFVTQYNAFLDSGKPVGLDVLADRMRDEHGSSFRGCIHYAPLNDAWRARLQTLMSSILSGE